MADERFHKTAFVRRRNRKLLAGALAPVLLAPLGFVLGATMHLPLLAALSVPAWFLGIAATIWILAKNVGALEQEGLLDASAEGVRFGGEIDIPRSQIREGFVVPRPRLRPLVRLVRKGVSSPFEIVVDDEAQGRAVLRALSLDASQSVAHFRLPSLLLTNSTYRVVSSIGLGLGIGLARILAHVGGRGSIGALIPLTAVLVFLAAMLFTPSRLEVGADGLVVSWLGRKRFIGYASLASFAQYFDGGQRSRVWGLRLILRSGEEIKVPIKTGRTFDDSTMPTIEERLREAIDTFRRGDAAADAALLRRGARDVAGWMRQLRSIGAGANAAMRTAPIEADRLWRVVEDPSAEGSARAGAAIALGDDRDPSVKRRLRAAAEAIAEPKVRIAIEAAAEHADEAALAEALGEIDVEDRGARVRST